MKTIFSFVLMIVLLVIFHNEIRAQGFTAAHNKNLVDALAATSNPNVKLMEIKSDSVFLNGTSLSWSYQYRSVVGSIIDNYFFHTTQNSAVNDSVNKIVLTGNTIISKAWIDSDSALALAEEEGGKDFRIANPKYKITASLGEPAVPSTMPRWYIYYISLDNPANKLFINIDATDSLLSGIRSSVNERPNKYVLYQNYPNPFNPTTTIKYSIPKASVVTIKVYDVLGSELTTLLNEEKPGGSYEVNFDATAYGTGVYFYRIQAGSFIETKKLVLIK